jgi:transcriptional antiterminator RfaH
MNSTEDRKWLAVYTKPRAEKKVEERLIKSGIEAFCPTYTTLRTWSDRKKKVELPLIPSYVFVKVAEKERLEVLKDIGVMNFIFWLGKPAIVREEEIQTLRTELKDTLIPEVKIGEVIKLNDGVFKGYEGKVKYVKNNSLVIVLSSIGLTITIKK